MIRTLAIENYRSLRHVVTELDTLTVVTGANGSGKTSVYRALRLLADLVRTGAIGTFAREGGMRSALFAGARGPGAVAMALGFASDDFSYAVDLGLPQLGPFHLDPEVKTEVVWAGPVLRPATTLADRKGPRVRLRDDDGTWQVAPWRVGDHESLLGALVDPAGTPELFSLREQARGWRFYDHLRTDADCAARRPGVATYTPVLGPGGDDLAAALLTVQRVGVAAELDDAVARAFDGASLEVTEEDDGTCRLGLRQPGLRRALGAAELSDGTLRFLMLAAATLSPRPPRLLVLNEPEASLHPTLVPAVAALVAQAAQRTQVVVVTHAPAMVDGLRERARLVELVKADGATTVAGQLAFEGPTWAWPAR